MRDLLSNFLLIIMALFFFGMLAYGFFIVLKPAPKAKAAFPNPKIKNDQHKQKR